MDYRISGERLKGFADQVRRISGVEGELTPEQMETNLLNVVPGSDLPNAEDFAFGTASNEYGISSYSTVGQYDANSNRQSFLRFKANETIAVYGFRAYLYAEQNTIKLWNSAKEEIASAKIGGTSAKWYDAMLDTPVNLIAGETYYVSTYGKGSCVASGVVLNSKLTGTGISTATANSATTWPSSFSNFSGALYGVPDIIIGSAIMESVTQEYKIQIDTMNAIADEVKRITDTDSTMSTAQIITALQGIATPTTE